MADTASTIYSNEYLGSLNPGVPKHVRLREAILSLIRKGLLKPGDQIPPEQVLCLAVGLSLGTVQKTLSDLAAGGTLTRAQGRGTFVAEARSPLEEVWQFRFVDRPGGDLLPIKIELIDRRKARAEGPWLQLLAAKSNDLCELRRRVIVNDSFVCVSQFFVATKRFPKLNRMPISEINLNLKIMLAEKFGAVTHSLDQYLQATAFEDDVCNYLALPRKAKGTVLHSLGRLSTGEIISYQYLAIPPGPYLLAAPVADNAWSSIPKAQGAGA